MSNSLKFHVLNSALITWKAPDRFQTSIPIPSTFANVQIQVTRQGTKKDFPLADTGIQKLCELIK